MTGAEAEIASALSLPQLPSVPAQIRAIEARQAALYAGQIPIDADVIDTILRTGSKGIVIGGKEYSVWFDELGFQVAEGHSVKDNLTGTTRHCHHVSNTLHIDEINKVKNLAWLCEPCHRMVHNGTIPPGLDAKVVKKIEKYRKKLNP